MPRVVDPTAHKRALQQRWPSFRTVHVPYVKTDNDVTNTAMLAVNTRLGFVATSESAEAILDL